MKKTVQAIAHPDKNEWYHPSFSYLLLTLADTLQERDGITAIIANDAQQANEIKRLLKSVLSDSTPILHLPSWETLPYDHFSPHRDIVSDRMTTLNQLQQLTQGVLITDIATAMTRLVPTDYLAQHVFSMRLGDKIDSSTFTQRLSQTGYRHASQVYEHGDFCVRGDIIDLFPMGSQFPIRLSLLDDEVDCIKTFDPDSQLSIKSKTSISLLPAEEYPLTEKGIMHFRQHWRQSFSGNPNDCGLYKSISEGRPSPGAEYYLPLFFSETATLFDYLPKEALLVSIDKQDEQITHFWGLITRRHEQYRHDTHKPICDPESCFISPDVWRASTKPFTRLRLNKEKRHSYGLGFSATALPAITKTTPRSHPFDRLKKWLSTQEKSTRLVFCAESNGRREVLKDYCINEGWVAVEKIDLADAYYSENSVSLVISPLLHGFYLPDEKTAFITEADLLGHSTFTQKRKRKKEAHFLEEQLIRDLSELKAHDRLCHRDHGVCEYEGLEVINADGCDQEFMRLRFDNNDTLYLPITALDRVGRYIGQSSEAISLSRLGSKQWDKKKEAAKKKVEDMASSLLDIYAKREMAKRPPAKPPNDEFKTFKAEFPFHETEDQSSAIQAIVLDMSKERSMDRLICGDVGFGKTEVAMQAAFHAIQQNRQVIFLAPTTLLASQHHTTCLNRFANWPIRIELFTRGITTKETQATLDGLANGSVDCVIATHKILHGDIRFKNLGLLIVDEEHRFGVAHKEKIKALKASVDMLAMTATPIPRTLNLSLSKMRDLSIISTPPAKRLSVKTFLEPYGKTLIEEAILREYNRGGQVFFLHNDIASMSGIAEFIQESMPQITTRIAHGKMTKNQLERIMADFQHQQFHVLIATTIIESGIDVPNANTIIINNADRFGLAQLHQCRGRVGRSHHQAYAYLLYDRHKKLTKEANLRLKALTENSELGAGFQLAMQDLDIRGAGELLGKEQSGQMEGVGYGLYLEMLEEAIAMQKGEKPRREQQKPIDIDFGVSALLPKNYIADIPTRLSLYKELSDLETNDEIEHFKATLFDRFGSPPEETKLLLESHRYQLTARKMGIKSIRLSTKSASCQFTSDPNIDVSALFKLIQNQHSGCKLIDKTRLSIRFEDGWDIHARLKKLKETLGFLSLG